MSVVYTITKKYLQYLQYLPIFNKSNKSLLYVPCIWRKRIMGLIKLSNRTLDTALLQYNSNHLKLHTSRSYTPQQLWWWIKIISRFNFSSKPYKTPIYWKCKIAISSLVKYQSQKKSIKLMWNLLNFPKFNFLTSLISKDKNSLLVWILQSWKIELWLTLVDLPPQSLLLKQILTFLPLFQYSWFNSKYNQAS